MGSSYSSNLKRACSAPVVLPAEKLHGSSSTVRLSASDDDLPVLFGRSATKGPRMSSVSSISTAELDNEEEKMKQKVLQTYEFCSIIGQGASAEVYLVKHRETGEKFACKVIKKNGRMNDDGTMQAEIGILKRLSHLHIAGMRELYETPTIRWIIMEMADGGNFQDMLVAKFADEYNEATIAKYFEQVLQGVAYLHRMGIVHRDLKSDNILCAKVDASNNTLDEEPDTDSENGTSLSVSSSINNETSNNNNSSSSSSSSTNNNNNSNSETAAASQIEYAVKISDFGLSAVVPSNSCGCCGGTSDSSDSVPQWEIAARKKFTGLTQQWGTTEHFAPEMHKKAYGAQVDVWALGCVLYQLLTGDLAFPTREVMPSLPERVLLNGGRKLKRSYQLKDGWLNISDLAKDLLNGMLRRHPTKRLSVEECLAHPWFKITAAAAATAAVTATYISTAPTGTPISATTAVAVAAEDSAYTVVLTRALARNRTRRELRLRKFAAYLKRLKEEQEK